MCNNGQGWFTTVIIALHKKVPHSSITNQRTSTHTHTHTRRGTLFSSESRESSSYCAQGVFLHCVTHTHTHTHTPTHTRTHIISEEHTSELQSHVHIAC